MSRRVWAAGGVLVLITSLATAGPGPTAQAAAGDLECADSLVQKTLKNGAAWRMCARIHPIKGLVLEKIEFKPATGGYEYDGYKRVLDQIYLAQLNIPYDAGMAYYNDITSFGFGKEALVQQRPELCPGEMLDVRQSYLYAGQLIERTIPGICTDEVPTGVTTHSQEGPTDTSLRFVDQGSGLQVSSLSKISWYEYLQKVTFDDHGAIDVALGATGDLAPTSIFYPADSTAGWPVGPAAEDPQRFAASHRHNAIYRVDFGIDGAGQQRVEEWNYEAPNPELGFVVEGRRTVKEQAFSAIPAPDQDDFTWWRVLNPNSLNRDGHPRSYEIVNKNQRDMFFDVTKPSVSFTNDHACQEYASDNLHPDCLGQSLLDYVADETQPLTDPVAWVNVGFHHVARDEDQSPMPMHWQSFQLVPRDFFAQSPSTPEARRCVNGPQALGSTVSDRPCHAVNAGLPRITANAAGIVVGTKLTTSSGTWNTGRTTWDYSYLWFRDGEPIVEPAPADRPQYVVTAADVGRAITVKVTASRHGYTSGTAESAPLVIPGGPSVSPETPVPTAAPGTPVPSAARTTSTARLVRSKVTTRQRAKVRVTVSADGIEPSGRVQIRHGSKVIARGTVSGGRGMITLPKLAKARTYRLRVVYLGTPTTQLSTSRLVILRVVRS